MEKGDNVMAGSVSEARDKMRKRAIMYPLIILAILVVIGLGGFGIYSVINSNILSTLEKKNESNTTMKETNKSSNSNLNSNVANKSDNSTSNVDSNNKNSSNESVTAKEIEETYSIDPMHKQIVDNLIYRNNLIVSGFYYGQHFESNGKTVNWLGYSLPQISLSEFNSYNGFISFLQETYTGSPMQEGSVVYTLTMPAKYLSGEYGELLYNTNFVEDGSFYYNGKPRIDWSDYVIKFTEESGNNINFVIGARDFNGSAKEIHGTAVYVNNRWLLNEVIY